MIHEKFHFDLYLIRHGESESNTIPGVISGKGVDSDLTSRGLQQARLLGMRLKREHVRFDLIYTSSYRRAIKTTETMLEAMGDSGALFTAVEAIREQELPNKWIGMPTEKVYTPDLRAYIAAKGSEFRSTGGESLRNVQRRVSNWLEDEIIYNPEFTERDQPFKIAIVGHGTATQCLMRYILGFDEGMTMRIALDNCSISRFRYGSRGWSLLTINDRLHIQETLS